MENQSSLPGDLSPGARLAAGKPNLPKGKRMREGTMVPPTDGRIVMVGRRWAFVSAGAEPVDAIPGGEFGTLDGINFRQGSPPPASPRPPAFRDQASASPTAPIGKSASTDDKLAQVTVVENLVLQRMVEAIRADPGDDRWTITGEITEFFDQNRLIIRTARRSAVE